MSWQNIDLTTINPQLEILPSKTFTFTVLPGAKYDDRDPDNISVNVAVVNDSEFSGRRLFLNYKPDDVKALKRLEQALGVDAEAGEDPVAYLNRAAGNNFTMPVTHSKPNEQYPNPKAFGSKWNVSAAA